MFAFVGSGFEHSIANQSVLGIALFLPYGEAISWGGFMWNQIFVGLGNIVGGAVLVGAAYWMSSPYCVTESVIAHPATMEEKRETRELFTRPA